VFKKLYLSFREWIKKLLHEEYLLEVFFAAEVILDPTSTMKVVRREKRSWKVKRIIKKSPKHIVAKDMNGHRLEIKSIEPFGYNITKIY